MSSLKKGIIRFFVFLLARPRSQRISSALFQLSIRGLGYESCCSPKTTGEEKFIRFIAKTNPRLCIDVGANAGSYSSVLLQATGADVIAFEPLPGPHRKLLDLKDQFGDRFSCFNWALGAENGTSTIWTHPNYQEGSSLLAESKEVTYLPEDGVTELEVEIKTLDESLHIHLGESSDEIDLLKIDVEGYELEVLRGASETLAKRKPRFIQVEHNWHHLFRGDNMRKISSFLSGYELFQLLPHGSGLVKRDPSRPESNLYFFSNFVFVRSDLVDSIQQDFQER